jgi:thioredoxin 1
MKKEISIIVLIMTFVNLGFGQVNFEDLTFDQALEKAEQEGKKVFIDVYTSWCGPCKSMDKNVFSDKKLGERISGDFVALKVDYEKSPNRGSVIKYKIKGYPTMLILDSKGVELGRVYGGRSLEGFNNELDKYVGAKLSELSKALAAVKNDSTDQEIWKKSLGVIYNNQTQLYNTDLSSAYSDARIKYYEKFDIQKIEDDLDLKIFYAGRLPLEHPVVQNYLNDSIDYATYGHMEIITRAFKKEVYQAKSKEEIKLIRVRASDYYDDVFEVMYGDVEEKKYFMDDIFKNKPSKYDEMEESEDADENFIEEANEDDGKKKKKRCWRKRNRKN